MKTFTIILFWSIIIAYLVIALGFTSESKRGVMCNEINVIIEDSLHRKFYTRSDIEEIINRGEVNILGYPLTGINTRKLEGLFQSKPYIRQIDVFSTMSGVLNVRVKQRDPVIRIITNEGRSCFMDAEGYVMPENRRFAQFVMVANGNFSGINQVVSTGRLDYIQEKEKYREWFEVLKLANRIVEDEFLSNQIVQIYLNKQGGFELIPRVGAHQIVLGDVYGLNEKLEKLKILYKKGLAYEGWNNYDKIDLRYKNQVVCTKR